MSNIFDIFKKIEQEKESKSLAPITHLVVGLGNPGDKYFYTRHNAGFLAMDYISQKCGAQVNRSKFKALVGEATIAVKRVLLMKTQTFMNLSGEAVVEAAINGVGLMLLLLLSLVIMVKDVIQLF